MNYFAKRPGVGFLDDPKASRSRERRLLESATTLSCYRQDFEEITEKFSPILLCATNSGKDTSATSKVSKFRYVLTFFGLGYKVHPLNEQPRVPRFPAFDVENLEERKALGQDFYTGVIKLSMPTHIRASFCGIRSNGNDAR
ncbi:unnamed protein product [Enterobius vermicularis]|uniref:ATPase_AAA_core domain-containing protein n=1 Tax=Enterobius vermicularis TaxID=51028 RepID=A0A0N4V4K8_ENTVE|nr:unnamed protein product [Enterobius vermicularis]